MPLPDGRVFLVNVGVNASHNAARSPLFPDGTFEWVPIPEAQEWNGPHSLRYRDLPAVNGAGSLADFVPRAWRDRPAHVDPDFPGRTYGDECQRTARARGLRLAEPGDRLVFLSRLCPFRDGAWAGAPVFALVGLFRIARIHHGIRSPRDVPSATLAKNAHFRRAHNNPAGWDGFSIFEADASAGRFRRALAVDRPFADAVLRDATGQRYRWGAHRSDLQVIGSYTRTCRAILDPAVREHRGRIAAFWSRVMPHAEDTLL